MFKLLSLSLFVFSVFIYIDAKTEAMAEQEELEDIFSGDIQYVDIQIVGGTTARPGEFPAFVQLWMDGSKISGGDDGWVYQHCGGTLISPTKVLTAAHCVTSSDLYALPNFHSFEDDFTFDDLIKVSSVVAHPQFSSVTAINDIAILTLSKAATTSTASVYGGDSQLVGDTSTAIGTGLLAESGGMPTILQKVDIPIVSNTTCNGAYGGRITSDMLCAGLSAGGRDTCDLDSGGPLWVTMDKSKIQAGIVSWGLGCARQNIYGVYARTSAFESFIKQYAPGARIVSDSGTGTPGASMAPIIMQLLSN